jgi:hypothetical protein
MPATHAASLFSIKIFYNLFMKKLNTLFSRLRKGKMLLLATAMMGTAGIVQAQTDIASYRFAKSTGTYTPITGGTAFIAANTPFDNEVSAAITIPAFTFGGASITSLYISANGYVTFGAAPATASYTPLSTAAATVTGVVAAMACDLGYTSATTTTGAVPEIRYEQVGTEFVVQWKDIKRWVSPNERMSFQIRLNSATGAIKIVYGGPIVLGTDTRSPQVGLRGNSNTWTNNVNNLYLLNAPIGTTCNWNDAITGNANDASFTMSSANTAMAPTDGLTYTWTPATSPAPVRTFALLTAVTGSGATISWTAPTGATQYNLQYRSPGDCNWTNYVGNPITGTSVVLTGLTSSTIYQIRLQSSDGTNTSIWSHIPSAAAVAGGSGYSVTGTFMTLCNTPVPGATIASTNNVCLGTPITFSMTTPGAGVTYQWQFSPDNVTYTNISGATAATLATTATFNYYRCAVTCATGPSTVNTTPVQVIYNNSVTGVTPGARCGIGSVNLAATGSAGSTLRWYAAATGGLPLGSGATFATPTISATTNFFAGAEGVVTGQANIGAGSTTSTTYPNPFYSNWSNSHNQYLITAADLQAGGLVAGNITSLAINITSGTTNILDFSIKMAATTATDMSAFVAPTFTPVYAAATQTPVIGLNTFTFSTPFNWNGTSNIVIEICQGNSGSTATVSSTVTADPTSYISVIHTQKNSSTAGSVICTDLATNLATYSVRPRFTFGGQAICSSVRSTVTATVNPPPTFTVTDSLTVCNNAVTALTVTSPVTNYNNYIWTPATNLYTNPAATTPYIAGANAATVYFKSNTAGQVSYIVTANNTTSLCATSDTSILNVLPSSATAVATPGSICTSGITTLTLTPASGYAAGKFQWQSSVNNTAFTDVAGATAISYTTPVTTSNVYYRAVIKNSINDVCFNSASDTARVYNPLITGTTPAARCGTGTLALGATASEGILNWYAAATGGASLATGNTFTTPSLAATTTYYVSASAGGSSGNATIGAGASVSVTTTSFEGTSPYAYHYGNYKHQMLITAAELAAAGITAGNINSLAFDVVTAGSPVANFNNFNITMIPTTQTVVTATFATGGTPVFSAPSVTPAVGLNTYTFTTPFAWNGTSNVIVQTCYNNNNSGANASSAEVRYDVTSFVSHTIYRVDGTQAGVCATTTGNASNDGPITSKRPKMIFGYVAGCQSPRTAVVATINTVPVAAITPASGPVQICQGNTTTFTATGGGNYQWRNAAGIIPTAQASTFTTGATGTYSVIVTTPATGCKDTSEIVAVNVTPLPVVAIGNDTAICSDYTLTLNAGNLGSTYLWDNGTTSQTRQVNATGTYSVKVTDTNACFKSDTIHVTVNPLPVVNLGNDTAFCPGNSLTLNAGNPGAHYLWNNGTTSQTLNAGTTGNYSVVVTDNNTCKGTDNINILVKSSPSGTVNAVYGDTATYTFNILNAQFVQSYTWNFGDGSPIATGAVVQHRFAHNGIYLVTVNLGGECSDSLGQSITVDVFDANGGTGIGKIDNPEDLLLYPNPAKDQITIENKNGLKLLNITAYNLLGQVVYNKKAESNDKHRLVISGIAPGMYTLKIETDKGIAIRKFEILK